jgi:hypothetical protein
MNIKVVRTNAVSCLVYLGRTKIIRFGLCKMSIKDIGITTVAEIW